MGRGAAASTAPLAAPAGEGRPRPEQDKAPRRKPSGAAARAAEESARVEAELRAAKRRRRAALAAGTETAEIDKDILRLRRRQRRGPRLKARDTLGKRYRLLEKLGRGGFATVWKALDLREDRLVAVKVLHHDLAEDPSRRRRFFRGAKRMADLKHPGVVNVLRTRCRDGHWLYFVMEYVEGGDLQHAVAEGRVSADDAPRLILGVAEALAHAHAEGLVHRDVTPSNILLDREGRPHLTDFDLVRAADTTGGTRTGALGKFFYAAPEALVAGKDADARADVYSLGVVAIFAFRGEVDGVLADGAACIERLLCATPLKSVLRRAVGRRPEDRYDDAAAFGRAWQAAMDGQGVVGEFHDVAGVGVARLTFPFETVTLDEAGREIERRGGAAFGWAENLGNGVTLEMIMLPGGMFEMGSAPDEEGRDPDEMPRHGVTLEPFAIGRFPVTQAQWGAVAALPRVGRDLPNDPAHFKGGELPVESVSWHQAVEFCARLKARTGREYQLPSEAQWEYAARAGTTTPFALGKTITPVVVNYNGNHPFGRAAKGDYRRQTTRVGELGVANPYGLFDMHGNVWEWCQDHRHDSYRGAPNDGRPWVDRGEDAPRVLRGGSWVDDAWYCRSACRRRNGPDDRGDPVGFRVLCSVARTR